MNSYPKMSSEDIGTSFFPSRLLILGMCPVGALLQAFPAETKVDHMLWESRPHTELPSVDLEKYDAVIVGMTLRHIINAAESPTDEYVSSDVAWSCFIGTDKIKKYFESCSEKLNNKIVEFREWSNKLPVLFLSFIEPRENYLGLLMPRYTLDNPAYFVQRLNQVMAETIEGWGNAWFIDVNEVLNSFGRMRVQDDYVNHSTHAAYICDSFIEHERDRHRIQLSTPPSQLYDIYPAVKEVTRGVVKRILDALKIISGHEIIKLIIIDLDDTLWRGIAADEPREIWGDPEGWPLGLIEALLVFKARGGILAVVSKNFEKETIERWNSIHYGRFGINEFASHRINFNPKSQNIGEILAEVNILPSNTLFIDDNPREIDEVRSIFPDIRVLSREHFDWRRKILFSPETQISRLSSESVNRTRNIQALIKREDAKKNLSREEWLCSLELKQSNIVIESTDHPNFSRAFELLNKTNQFNTTGKRWTHGEIQELFENGGQMVCVSLKDRMVDNGLVGVSLIAKEKIIQVVLSCRVFGLAVEQAMLNFSTNLILKNHSFVHAIMKDTGKNFTCHNYFTENEFTKNTDGSFTTTAIVSQPSHITIE